MGHKDNLSLIVNGLRADLARLREQMDYYARNIRAHRSMGETCSMACLYCEYVGGKLKKQCPTHAELAQLRAERGTLAAENRVLRIGLEEGAFDELGNCTLCGDTGQQAERHATHCPVGAAMLAPHTARESSLSCGHPLGCWIIDGKNCGCGWCAAVAKCDALTAERVKALEVVAEAAGDLRPHGNETDITFSIYKVRFRRLQAALDKLSTPQLTSQHQPLLSGARSLFSKEGGGLT